MHATKASTTTCADALASEEELLIPCWRQAQQPQEKLTLNNFTHWHKDPPTHTSLQLPGLGCEQAPMTEGWTSAFPMYLL